MDTYSLNAFTVLSKNHVNIQLSCDYHLKQIHLACHIATAIQKIPKKSRHRLMFCQQLNVSAATAAERLQSCCCCILYSEGQMTAGNSTEQEIFGMYKLWETPI